MKKTLAGVGTAITLGYLGMVNKVQAATSNTLSLDQVKPEGINVQDNASELIPRIVTMVFVIAAALTFFYLIWGAIKWITAAGDKSKVEDARNKITGAIVGLLILAAVYAIFQLVLTVAFGSGSTFTIPTLAD